jgi:benzoyl-CoA reductase/2-hydroxyglutaryl-CoA dehydratase subunit BcrC/BadD/HgdB
VIAVHKQPYLDELTRLQEHENACNRLINLIADGNQDLDMSDDMATITTAVLSRLSDTISRRIQAVDHLIEADSNKTMDRLRRRQIT